jgi:hypothetical protein
VIGAAIMGAATFVPYVGWYGDGLLTADEYPNQVSSTLITGSDVWFVLGVIATLVVAAVCHVAGFRRRATNFLALGASLVAAGLAVKLPGTYFQDGIMYGTPHLIDVGVYMFLGGAATSVVGALLMAATGLGRSRSKVELPLTSSLS